ncbi:MAG: InlB B-repeat-containing protein [Clostridia bacterium]|nr:InlB B-repeat-containing protein [Clostridia bacterium]
MKKRWLALLFTLVGVLVCAFGLVACGGNSSGGSSVRGTYYAYENGELNKDDYITLSTGGKCEISALSLDFEDAKITSTYKTSGSSITITVTVEFLGEKESETITGTVSGGVLELDMLGTYYQEGKQPGNGDDPINPPSDDEVRITLNANGGTFSSGSNTMSVNVKKGDTISLDSVPTRTGGYVLSGWATDKNGNNLFDIANERITGEITTLYAVWARQITVTLNANGGAFENGNETYETIVANGATVTVAQTPVRDGYQFTGWYTDRSANEGSEWDLEKDTVTRTITLYAGWKPEIDDYQVTYYPNYDGAEPVVMSTENGKATYVPERTGYVFNGWWYDANPEFSTKFDSTKLVTSNITLYADWILESEAAKVLSAPASIAVKDGYITWSAVTGASSYRVIVTHISDYETVIDYDATVTGTSVYFPGSSAGNYGIRVRANGNGETTVNSSYSTYSYSYLVLSQTTIDFDITNSVLTWTAVPNARYYELVIDNETVQSSTRYTYYDMSEYEAGTHSVRIIAKNESYGYISSTASTTVNKLRLKTPVVTVDANSANRGYILTWDEVAHADSYVVTFGTQTATINKPTGDAGWTPYFTIGQNSSYWNDQSLTFSVKAYDTNNDYLVSAATEDRELTKLYELNAYSTLTNSTEVYVYSGLYYGGAGRATVSFDLNGASGYISSQTVTGSNPLSYPSVPTRTGYVFGGWYTTPSCTGTPYDFSAEITSPNLTLYAKWVSYEGYGMINYNDSLYVSNMVSKDSNTYQYYAFVPLKTGIVTIQSRDGLSDTYGYLYDCNKILIESDDDDGDGNNFLISRTLNAGELYYIRPCGYNSSGSTTVYISGDTPSEGGVPTGGYLVPYGEEITLRTERNYNSTCIFEGWYQVVNGVATKIEGDPDSPYRLTYTAGAENVEYYANWIPNPVTVETLRRDVNNSSDLNGGYSGSLSSAYKVGDTVTLTAYDYNGYTFLGWYIDGNVSNLLTNSRELEITVTTEAI